MAGERYFPVFNPEKPLVSGRAQTFGARAYGVGEPIDADDLAGISPRRLRLLFEWRRVTHPEYVTRGYARPAPDPAPDGAPPEVIDVSPAAGDTAAESAPEPGEIADPAAYQAALDAGTLAELPPLAPAPTPKPALPTRRR